MSLLYLSFLVVIVSIGYVRSAIYTDGTTALVLSQSDQNNKSCSVYDVGKEQTSSFWKNNADNVYLLDFTTISKMIHDCQSGNGKPRFQRRFLHKRSIFNILEGLYPGTKWCGRGDIADNITDLGYYNDTDACCREHDHCPEYIQTGATKYGLHNDFQYTICSCDCDNKLRSCLQDVGTFTSRAVGSLFFNVVGIQCIVTRPVVVNGVVVEGAELLQPDPYDQGVKVHSFSEVLAGNVTVTGWLGSLFGGK